MDLNAGLYLASAILNLGFLIYRPFRDYRKSIEHKIVTFLLINLFLTSAASVIQAYLININAPNLALVNKTESFFYFSLHTFLTPLLALYLLRINGAAKNRSRMYYVIFWLPVAIGELLVLLTPFFHLIFYYDEQGIYHRGPFLFYLYLVAAIYFVHAVISFIKSWKILDNEYLSGYQIFLIMIAFGVILQCVMEDLQIECIFDTLALLGLIIVIDCNDGLIDKVTKLPNQSAYRININLYRTYNYKYTVVNIRLLNLSYYAHLMSEEALNYMVWSITESLDKIASGDEIYRYDNETFIIIVPTRKNVEDIVAAVSAYMEQTMYIDDFLVELHTLISVAHVPEDVDTPKLHFQLAEYKPKSVTKQINVLRTDNLKFLKKNVRIEAIVHNAVQDKSFDVYYQPIWGKEQNKIVSCEALCRLNDPEGGFISPADFISIAEQNGTIVSIGDIVFEKVCRDISAGHFKKLGIEYVEVNLSLYQLMSKDLVERYKNIVDNYHIRADMINLEITESSSIAGVNDFANIMEHLREVGFSFSLDDYGTAYSNITNVMSAHYRNIKMDASILWKSENDLHTKILLDSTIRMFRNLGNNVIQEGVENQEQLDFVLGSGANLVQGYYFSKPLLIDEFVDYVRKFNKQAI
ncbi:MAG: EAL domain-containing protein [Treponema sp.]|nr:EAL domain-containing protein [Treponema sp.]